MDIHFEIFEVMADTLFTTIGGSFIISALHIVPM